MTLAAPREDVLLGASGLVAGYRDLAVVRNVDLSLFPAEVVALVGPNGSGKTTLMRTLAGAQRPLDGDVIWEGSPTKLPLHLRSRAGTAFVADDRSIVRGLSSRDNLRLGQAKADQVLRLFPQLTDHLGRLAGTLSGGEQQMLTIGRALARKPKVLLVDELSLGLAPQAADVIAAAIRGAAAGGLSSLVVEQDLRRALTMSDRFILLIHGAISLVGQSCDYRGDLDALRQLYFGLDAATGIVPADQPTEVGDLDGTCATTASHRASSVQPESPEE